MDAQHFSYGRHGYFGNHDASFIEVSGNITVIPCRIAKMVDPLPTHPRNVIEIQSSVHDEWGVDHEYTSFRVGGDGFFLREDYMILGGTEMEAWGEDTVHAQSDVVI